MNLLVETLNGANINKFATTIKSAHIIKIDYVFDDEHLVLLAELPEDIIKIRKYTPTTLHL